MTVSLAERARQGRLIALEAVKVKNSGADILVLSSRRKETAPVFMTRRTEGPAAQLLVA